MRASHSLFLKTFPLLALTAALQGCGGDAPVTPPPSSVSTVDSTLHAPLNFKARDAQSDSTSIDLSWQHNPLDTGTVNYLIRWRPDTSSAPAKDSALSQSVQLTVRTLVTGVRYRFEIQSVRNGLHSTSTATDTATPRAAAQIISAPPTPPSQVRAISGSTAAVALAWKASTDTGAITYTVKYASIGAVADSGVVNNISGSSVTITGLDADVYTFKVYAVRGSYMSTAASVTWAPATRYNSSTIRMYEKASTNGSGLIVDPALGGPANTSMSASNPNPERVQLALFVDDMDNTIEIGPAYSISEYKNIDGFDRNVYVSDSIYRVPSLDEWYDDRPIDKRIDSDDGNISYFTLPTTSDIPGNFMFYLRTGVAGNYHYARIMMKKAGNKILQGSNSNRYVELEISYQNTPNLPYAKRPAGAATPQGWLPAMRRP